MSDFQPPYPPQSGPDHSPEPAQHKRGRLTVAVLLGLSIVTVGAFAGAYSATRSLAGESEVAPTTTQEAQPSGPADCTRGSEATYPDGYEFLDERCDDGSWVAIEADPPPRTLPASTGRELHTLIPPEADNDPEGFANMLVLSPMWSNDYLVGYCYSDCSTVPGGVRQRTDWTSVATLPLVERMAQGLSEMSYAQFDSMCSDFWDIGDEQFGANLIEVGALDEILVNGGVNDAEAMMGSLIGSLWWLCDS